MESRKVLENQDREAAPHQQPNAMPPSTQLADLQKLLQSHDWQHAQSNDELRQARGKTQWAEIESGIGHAVAAGHLKEVEGMWQQWAASGQRLSDAVTIPGVAFHAVGSRVIDTPSVTTAETPPTPATPAMPASGSALQDKPAPTPAEAGKGAEAQQDRPDEQGIAERAAQVAQETFGEAFRKPAWAKRAEPASREGKDAPKDKEAAPESKPAAAEGGGTTIKVTLPTSREAADSRPAGPDAGEGGGGGNAASLAKFLGIPLFASNLLIKSAHIAGEQASSFYVKSRIDGHAVLGQQVEEKAAEISQLSSSLKKAGMGGLIDDMRATGQPLKEILANADKAENKGFLQRFDKLMENKGFAADYEKLQHSLEDFRAKASRYAKSGVDMNMDFSEVLDRNMEKISKATEGFISKKNGVFESIQESVQKFADRIAAIVSGLIRNFAAR